MPRGKRTLSAHGKNMTFEVNKKLKKLFKIAVARKGTTVSEALRECMREYVKAMGGDLDAGEAEGDSGQRE